MINIGIKTDGKEVADSYEEKKPTLEECALMVYRLEEIKQFLLSKEFEDKFRIDEGSFAEED